VNVGLGIELFDVVKEERQTASEDGSGCIQFLVTFAVPLLQRAGRLIGIVNHLVEVIGDSDDELP